MLDQQTAAYRIEGGYPVIGEITCLGAKNFVIKAMVAALLACRCDSDEKVRRTI